MSELVASCLVICQPAVFFLLEYFFPDKQLPVVKGWRFRVILFNIIQLVVIIVASYTWEPWLQATGSLFNLRKSLWFQDHIISGGFICYLISVPVFGCWHRLRHETQCLWRIFHQLHHSPSTFESLMAFYKHPLEMIVDSIIMSVLLYPILGLSQASSVWLSLFASTAEWVYHSNLYFPWYCDYIFQTPRNHRLHHLQNQQCMGVNYSDIPWMYDMWVGTFVAGSSPILSIHEENQIKIGFETKNEERILDMLIFRDLLHPERPWFYFNSMAYKISFQKIWKSQHPKIHVCLCLCLVLLGSLGFIGYILPSSLGKPLRAVGFVSGVAPLPLVFTAYNGQETFSTGYRFEAKLTWETEEYNLEVYLTGRNQTRNITGEITNKVYSLFHNHPYHIRNVFGVIASHGPFWHDPGMQNFRTNILHYGACREYNKNIRAAIQEAYNITHPVYVETFTLHVLHRNGSLLDTLQVKC